MRNLEERNGTMGVEIKVLGRDDLSLLGNVAPDVFDDPIDEERAAQFLRDPRRHLVVAVEDGQVSASSPPYTTSTRTSRAAGWASTGRAVPGTPHSSGFCGGSFGRNRSAR
jgi:hypothetical protein